MRHRERLVWYRRTLTAGEEPGLTESFVEIAEVWATVQEMKSYKQIAYAYLGGRADLQITVTGVYPFQAVDQLHDKYSGAIYLIDGVHTDKYRRETYVTAHRFEEDQVEESSE